MAQHQLYANGKVYTVAMDDRIPLAERNWAVIKGRVFDEITTKPPKTLVDLETDQPGLISKTVTDGLVGLLGKPLHLFPELNIQNYPFHFEVKAPGYIPLDYDNQIGLVAEFPDVFFPFEIPDGDLSLHREPIIISGRVVNNSTITPFAGAGIDVVNIWRFLPEIGEQSNAEAPDIVSLQPPLYINRTAGGAQIRRQNIAVVNNEDKYLLRHTASGSSSLYISDYLNIVASDVIVIEENDPELAEYCTIDSISGSSVPNGPALITLTHPVARAHGVNAIVKKVNLSLAGADNMFGSDAIAGDSCVFLDSMTNLINGDVVHIHDGVNPDEYHTLSRFSVSSNSNGYFRLPSLNRVAQVKIEVQGVGDTITEDLTIDYSQKVNRIDFKI